MQIKILKREIKLYKNSRICIHLILMKMPSWLMSHRFWGLLFQLESLQS